MGRKNQIRKARKQAKKNPIKKSKPFELYFLLVSTIIIIPLVFSKRTLDPDLGPRMLALAIVILAISIYYISRTLKKRPEFSFVKLPVFLVFGLYFIMSVFSMTQAINPTEGLFDIVRTFLTLALLVYMVQVFISNNNYGVILTKLVVLSSVIATSVGVYQYFAYIVGSTGYELSDALYSVKGLMAHKNQFVISMYLMLPFTIYGIYKFKKTWLGISILQTLMILLNIVILQTRSVWVATVIFAFSFTILWLIFSIKNKEFIKPISLKHGVIIGVIVLIVVSGSAIIFKKTGTVQLLQHKVSSLFDSKSHDNQGRLKMWESTLELAQDNIYFGVGAGNWKISVLPYYNVNFGSSYQNWRRPHNDFLWVLSEKGIFALTLYILTFLIITIYGIKIIFRETDKDKLVLTSLLISGISGYFIIALFTFPMERINHQIYITIMMAGVISMYYKNPTVSKKSNLLYNSLNLTFIILAIGAIFYSTVMIRSEVTMNKLYSARKSKNWKKVIMYADKAHTSITTLDAYSMPIHSQKGLANLKLNNKKQAFIDYKVALEYFPTQISTLNNLAIVSAEMGNADDAIFYFKKALKIYPNYKTSLFNLAKAYYKQEDYSNAYVTFLNCSPDNTPEDYDRFKNALIHKLNKPGE